MKLPARDPPFLLQVVKLCPAYSLEVVGQFPTEVPVGRQFSIADGDLHLERQVLIIVELVLDVVVSASGTLGDGQRIGA